MFLIIELHVYFKWLIFFFPFSIYKDLFIFLQKIIDLCCDYCWAAGLGSLKWLYFI